MRVIFRTHRNDSAFDELEIVILVDEAIRLHAADVICRQATERGAGKAGELHALFSKPILASPSGCGEPHCVRLQPLSFSEKKACSPGMVASFL